MIFGGIMALFLLNATNVMSQRGNRFGPSPQGQPPRGAYAPMQRPQQPCFALGIESLSPEQQEQIRKINLARLEKSSQHRVEMEEMAARKRSLLQVANPDMNAVNQVIDQMSAKRATWLKENVAHRQEIRNLLTEEQRIIYDSRPAMRRQGAAPGRGRAPGMGYGPCMRSGARR